MRKKLSARERRRRDAAYKRAWNARNRGRYRAAQERYAAKFFGYPTPTRPRPKRCECCGGKPNGQGNRLHLDHDHKTKKFRGWVCSKCNTGIGLLGDTVRGLKRAIQYLRRKR